MMKRINSYAQKAGSQANWPLRGKQKTETVAPPAIQTWHAAGPLPYPGHVEKVPNYNTVDPIYADTFPVVTGCAAAPPRPFEFVF